MVRCSYVQLLNNPDCMAIFPKHWFGEGGGVLFMGGTDLQYDILSSLHGCFLSSQCDSVPLAVQLKVTNDFTVLSHNSEVWS